MRAELATIAMGSVARLERIQFSFLRTSEHAREKSVSETRVMPQSSSTTEDSWSVDETRNSCSRELGGRVLHSNFF